MPVKQPVKQLGKPVLKAAPAAAKAVAKPVANQPAKSVDKSTSKSATKSTAPANTKPVTVKSAPVATNGALRPAVAATKSGKVEIKAQTPLKPVPSAPVVVATKAVKGDKPRRTPEQLESREARNGIAIAAPVPTDGKPAKSQAGFRSSELENYRDMLFAKRREITGDMHHMESEALQRGGGSNLSNLPIHMADMGTDNYEQEFTLGLMEKDRKLLREINDALAKIQNGTYGLCEATGKPIGKPRLEAQPWARFSIEHARKLEKRIMGH